MMVYTSRSKWQIKTDLELSPLATDARFNDGKECYICKEFVFITQSCSGPSLGCSFSCGMGANLSGSCRRASSGRRRSRLLRTAVARYSLKRIYFCCISDLSSHWPS